MWASARSTWLAVGPGCDSLLLRSQNNAAALPVTLCPSLVQQSCWSLLSLSPRFLSKSLNAGRLSVITGMPEHLFGKQGQLSPWTHCLLGIPPFFSLRLWFYMFGLSCQASDNEQRLSNEGRQEIPFVNFLESLCWLLNVFACPVLFPVAPRTWRCFVPLFIHGKLKHYIWLFTANALLNIQVTWHTFKRYSIVYFDMQLFHPNICSVSCSKIH